MRIANGSDVAGIGIRSRTGSIRVDPDLRSCQTNDLGPEGPVKAIITTERSTLPRVIALDVWRGLIIVVMALDHANGLI